MPHTSLRKISNSLIIFLASLVVHHFAVAESTPDIEQVYLQHDGERRRADVFVPPAIKDSSRIVPLVLVLHGGGGNGQNAAMMTGFSNKAMQQGFIVAYPYGTGRLRNKLLTWNVVHCCGYAMKQNADDVGFISRLIDKLISDFKVDPKRVYVTGMSNGGMMTHRIGIELSDKVAAIAPVVASLFGDEPQPKGPVAALMINGALDGSIPLAGGLSNGRGADAWDGTPSKPGVYQGSFWAAANGCQSDAQISTHHESGSEITKWRYVCPEGLDVVRYVIGDNGHAWPGGEKGSRRGDTPSQAMNATDAIWDFFKLHSR